MKKISLLPSDRKPNIRHWMAPLRMLYVMILTYIFKVTNFEMRISQKRSELAKILKRAFITIDICHRMEQSWVVVLRDLNLNFQGQISQVAVCQVNTENAHITIAVRYEVRYLPAIAPPCMSYITTLTNIFKVTHFEMWISRKRWELAKNAQAWFL